MEQKPEISVISPVYNSADIIPELLKRLHAVLQSITPLYEIILVDDASLDESAAVISTHQQQDSRVKTIMLSQNGGQHPAILHGLLQAKGAVCIVMDCDLQDPPEAISTLYRKMTPEIDAVFGIRKKSYNTSLQKILSALFYRCLSVFSGVSMSHDVANFGAYKRDVVEALLKKKYRYFLFPLAVRQVSKHICEVEVEHARRFAGRSAYTFSKATTLALRAIVYNSFLGIIFRKMSVQELTGFRQQDDTI